MHLPRISEHVVNSVYMVICYFKKLPSEKIGKIINGLQRNRSIINPSPKFR